MSLLTLSNELIIPILRYLMPDDIDSVSVSCKLIRHLCLTHLSEHQEMKQKYRHLQMYQREAVPHSFHSSPTRLMHTILENPSFAYYPRYLEIILHDDEAHKATPHREWEDLCGDVYMEDWNLALRYDQFMAQLLACPYMDTQDAGYYHEIAQRGVKSGVQALLLTLLPNLEKVTFRHCSRMMWYHITPIIMEIVTTSRGRKPLYKTSGGGAPNDAGSRSHALSKLKTVNFEDPDKFNTNKGCSIYDYEAMLAFAQLPSIRTISARNVFTRPPTIYETKLEDPDDYFEDTNEEDGGDVMPFACLKTLDAINTRTAPYCRSLEKFRATSNVQSLILRSCEADEETFPPLLMTIRALRSFEFSRTPNYRNIEAFSTMLASLVEYAGHSLETLTLGTQNHDTSNDVQLWGHIGDLQCFTQLTSLTLDAEYLLDDRGKAIPLLSSLPSSVEVLRLGHIDNAMAALKRMERGKAYDLLMGTCSNGATRSSSSRSIYAEMIGPEYPSERSRVLEHEETCTDLKELFVWYPERVRSILDEIDKMCVSDLGWLEKLFEASAEVSDVLSGLRELFVETVDERVPRQLEKRFAGTKIKVTWST